MQHISLYGATCSLPPCNAKVLEHRTKADWAGQMKWLADEIYPDAERIIMVCDNLNTHDKSSFYEAFPQAENLSIIITPLPTQKPATG